METFGTRLRKTAEEVADRLNEAAQTAGERIAEMREIQRLNTQIRALQREKERCKLAMADLLIRMFDQETFAEGLLRPEYLRIKEVDEAIAAVEIERAHVMARANQPAAGSTPTGSASAAAQTAETGPVVEDLVEQVPATPDDDTPPTTTYEE